MLIWRGLDIIQAQADLPLGGRLLCCPFLPLLLLPTFTRDSYGVVALNADNGSFRVIGSTTLAEHGKRVLSCGAGEEWPQGA